MKSILVSLSLFLAILGLKSQNESYIIFNDSIYPIIESDYTKAKSLLIKYQDILNPHDVLYQLDVVLKKGDIEFYKDRIQFLMKNYGLNYSEIDLVESRSFPAKLQAQISKNHLTQWMIEESTVHYLKWLSQHPNASYFQEKVSALKIADQAIRRFSSISDDSIFKDQIYLKMGEIDFEHLQTLIELYQLNDDKMLNDFENGMRVYLKSLSIIIWHNFKSKNNHQKAWDLLLPYIEKSYFEKKIDFSIFKLYDMGCKYHSDYQYYGTLDKSIPIHDLENYAQRRKKYYLENFSLEP